MYTLPKFGIGERVILIPTPHGTIMWDLLAYMDDETIKALKSPPFNGIKAIVISHPHYYTTHLDWAEALDCPVYIAAEDEGWTSRQDTNGRRRLIQGATAEIVPGLTAIKVGGHFPGSLVLHWKKMLFLADSVVTQPVRLYPLFPRLPLLFLARQGFAAITDELQPLAVRSIPHPTTFRHHFVHLHVVHPKHDPPATVRGDQNVACYPALRV
jgi:glyoxylase-like metal-dependent hydrolase (beta-lactamase superfamily II)